MGVASSEYKLDARPVLQRTGSSPDTYGFYMMMSMERQCRH